MSLKAELQEDGEKKLGKSLAFSLPLPSDTPRWMASLRDDIPKKIARDDGKKNKSKMERKALLSFLGNEE